MNNQDYLGKNEMLNAIIWQTTIRNTNLNIIPKSSSVNVHNNYNAYLNVNYYP